MLQVELSVLVIFFFSHYQILFENAGVLLLCSVNHTLFSLLLVIELRPFPHGLQCLVTLLVDLIVLVVCRKLDVRVLIVDDASKDVE